MNKTVALRLLGEIMGWDDERATQEYQWLGFMAKLKYDGYRDFVAGARFLESLAGWLRQFKKEDREAAYSILRDHLIYIGPLELRRLVEAFYPEVVHQWIIKEVAARRSIPDWQVNVRYPDDVRRLLRQTLFVALSEGAHTDAVRHATPELSNEQIIVSHQVGTGKWRDLIKRLRRDVNDAEALFARAYLIDDFTASGTTLIRQEEDGTWDGKIPKFLKLLAEVQANIEAPIFEKGWTLGAHHYISTSQAADASLALLGTYSAAHPGPGPSTIELSHGYLLPSSTRHDVQAPPFIRLVNDYYDPSIETDHNKAGGGGTDIRAGYKSCALTVVLEHNTPNNTLPLIWAESTGLSGGHEMRPLFRRRQRHT